MIQVTPALELEHGAALHEPVEDGDSHGGIDQVFSPVLHHPVGGDDYGTVQLVALMDDGLQDLGGFWADALCKQQVVEHQQVGLDPALEQLGALSGASQRVAGKLSIGLQVAHVIALTDGLVGQRLGNMALAGAWLAHDQSIASLCDELERVQTKAVGFGQAINVMKQQPWCNLSFVGVDKLCLGWV
jgi:hypothetical protein